jgi:hypothetical protein
MIRSSIQIGAIALMALTFAYVGASASTAGSEPSAGIRAVQSHAAEGVQVAVVCRYVVRAGRRVRVCN